MSEWKEVKLGDIAHINMGQSPESAFYNSDGFGMPLIQGNADIKERKSIQRIWTTQPTKICDEGDILMTVRAPVGNIGISSLKSCLGRGVCGIKALSIDGNYLYHLLISAEDSWKQFEQGSTFTAVGSKEIFNFQLSVLNSDIAQKRIAHILNTCDTVIEQTQSAIAKYKAIKQGLLYDLFTRGLDANGRLRPSFSDAPELYKESELGMIPKEWEVKRLDYYFSFLRSGLSRLLSEQDIGIPVIISGNIQDNKLDFTSLRYWYTNDPQGANTESFLLSEGDILLCFINSIEQIGKVAIFEGYTRPCIYTTNLFRIKASKEADPKFVYHLLSSGIVQNKIKIIVKPAVNQASFTTKDFCKIPVPGISKKEQIKIIQNIDLIDNVIQSEETLLQKYQSIKRGLMGDLLGGKKEVNAS